MKESKLPLFYYLAYPQQQYLQYLSCHNYVQMVLLHNVKYLFLYLGFPKILQSFFARPFLCLQ